MECKEPVQVLEHGHVEAENGEVRFICDADYEISIGEIRYGKEWVKRCRAEIGNGAEWGWECGMSRQRLAVKRSLCDLHPECLPIQKGDSALVQLSRGALLEGMVQRSSHIDSRGLIRSGIAPGSLLQGPHGSRSGDLLAGSGADVLPKKPASSTDLRIHKWKIEFADGGFKLEEDWLKEPSVDEVAGGGSVRTSMVCSAMLWTLIAVTSLWDSFDQD